MNFERFRVPPGTVVKLKNYPTDETEPFKDKSQAREKLAADVKKLAELQSKKRTRSIALPRQVCMYLARTMTRHSLEEIGGYFGGRDHTTVLHAKRTIQSRCERDAQFQATMDLLAEEIHANT